MERLEKSAPWIFVIIWSSGFLVAKYAFKSSDVLYFLAIRLLLAAFILALITIMTGNSLKLPHRDLIASIGIGLCLHALYLGGVWEAIAQGAPSGIASVITSLQPVLVSIIAIGLLGETLTRMQVLGLLLGFAGVLAVLAPAFSRTGEMTLPALALLILALLGSTTSTLSQKKIGHSIPLLAGTTYQFLAAGIVLLVLSIARSEVRLDWNLESSLAMLWAVLVTSIVAILLLLWMLGKGSAAKVSSALYLVPPVTALQAFILFGEKLNAQAIIGIAMTALGVALVQS